MERGEPLAMIAVLAAEGSAPRAAGTRMFVTQDRAIGTIGGGNLEFQAIRQARAILARPVGDWRVQDYPLGPLLGQCCGGRVRLLVEHVDPAKGAWLKALGSGAAGGLETRFGDRQIERAVLDRAEGSVVAARGPMPGAGDRIVEPIDEDRATVTMFGAGHVGVALAALLDGLPFGLAWCDSRSEFGRTAGLQIIDAEAMAELAAETTGAVLIMTHDHALDFTLTKAALRGSASFVGLIGSRTKKARFLGRLRRAGVGEQALARLVCPIGLKGVGGKEPNVIAVAVAAQLLTLYPEPGWRPQP